MKERFNWGSQFQGLQSIISRLHCFLACGEAVLHSGRAWHSKTAHLMTARKQRQQGVGARHKI